MYQALYRKWRPKTFDEVVGQKHVTDTLRRQVEQDRLSHAYLFTGTRGTGKTTCAKLLARAVNCENPQNGNPCGKCPSCLGIENGSILDVLEIDAASNNSIDNVRALREDAVYSPASVRKRVYIIDEVHMLSNSAFNALLKIIEEPPEHLMFILATTELQKVPATILSRCQRYSFKRASQEDIEARVKFVAQQEGIEITDEACQMLARMADGSFRDALTLLDQCSGGEVTRERVINAIGIADSDEVCRIFRAVAAHDGGETIRVLDELYAAGREVSSVLDRLAELYRDLLIVKLVPKGGASLIKGGFSTDELSRMAEGVDSAFLLGGLDELEKTISSLRTARNRRIAAELCLLRLCDFIPGVQAAPASAPSVAAPAPARPAPELKREAPASEREIYPARDQAEPRRSAPAAQPEPANAPAQEKPAPAEAQSGELSWKKLVSGLRGKLDEFIMTLLDDETQCAAEISGGVVRILAKSPFTKTTLDSADVKEAVAQAAQALSGRVWRTEIDEFGSSKQDMEKKLGGFMDKFAINDITDDDNEGENENG